MFMTVPLSFNHFLYYISKLGEPYVFVFILFVPFFVCNLPHALGNTILINTQLLCADFAVFVTAYIIDRNNINVYVNCRVMKTVYSVCVSISALVHPFPLA